MREFGKYPVMIEPPPPPLPPEARLQRAVLKRALMDIFEAATAEERAEAREWMFGEELCPAYPFSYSSCCEAVGVAPDRFRQKIWYRMRFPPSERPWYISRNGRLQRKPEVPA